MLKEPKTVSSVIEKTELEVLEDIGWRDHLERSEVIRKAIQEYNKNHGEGNDTFRLEQFQDPNFIAMPATMSSKDQWNVYIRKHMDKKERIELDQKLKFMRSVIEAANWKDDRNAKIPDRT